MSTDDTDDGGDSAEPTTLVTRKGQVTIPKRLRDSFGITKGDEPRWEETDDGIRVKKSTASAGRGMLAADDVSEEKREEMAVEMTREIRERRRSDWRPE